MSLSDNILLKKEDLIASKDENTENIKEFVVHTTRNPDSAAEANTEMTHVMRNLFMGSLDPALDRDLLKENNVKHILTLGLLNVPHFEGISYTHLRLHDRSRFDILPHLETAINVIDSARQANQAIYVHCQVGVSRSATVVIAYLMKLNSWSYSEAYKYMKKLRPCIEPNEGFVKQLKNYEKNILNN